MKIKIFSYSHSLNNNLLAKALAKELSTNHTEITEPNKRTNFRIGVDMIFNRNPKINSFDDDVTDVELVIFIAPVWMGQIAAPLRTCIKKIKSQIKNYAFVSISGGADGDNPRLMDELTKRTGKSPLAIMDFHIVDFLPQSPKPTREMTSSYKVTDENIKTIVKKILENLEEKFGKQLAEN